MEDLGVGRPGRRGVAVVAAPADLVGPIVIDLEEEVFKSQVPVIITAQLIAEVRGDDRVGGGTLCVCVDAEKGGLICYGGAMQVTRDHCFVRTVGATDGEEVGIPVGARVGRPVGANEGAAVGLSVMGML